MTQKDPKDLNSALDEDQELVQFLMHRTRAERERERQIQRRDETGYAPLSFAQQRMWFLEQLEPGGRAYTVPMSLRMRGQLDVEVLRRCLEELIQRHEVLRTTFKLHQGEAVQVVGDAARFDLPLEDLSLLPGDLREAAILDRIAQLREIPFDLDKGPLIHVELLRVASDEHVLSMALHHIVTDAWSLGILFRELGELYRAYAHGEASTLSELPIQYADYAAWQRGWLQGEVLESQLAYWREQLAGSPTLNLPSDRARPAVQTFVGARALRRLSPELSSALEALARRYGVTPFMLLLSAYSVLLHRYSGQDDIVVGTPIAGRNRAEVEPLVGFFINTLPVRVRVSAGEAFSTLLSQVSEASLGLFAHQDVPFEKLVEELQPDRDPSRNPLYSVIFTLQTASVTEPDFEGLKLEMWQAASDTTRFDLECHVTHSGTSFLTQFVYNTDLFEASTIERLLLQYERVLESVVSNPEVKISAIELLDAAERGQLLQEWNATSVDYAGAGSVVSEFARQVRETPESLAVEYAGEGLSYRELDERSNQLAHWLRGQGVERGSLVGLCLERSLELVIGILGVLKAGGGYVPLDAEYPMERLAYMVADTGVQLVLCLGETVEAMSALDIEAIDLESRRGEIEQEIAAPPEVELDGGDVAYVMYTSGSTGWPKGVVVEHRSVLRLVRGANYVELGAGEVMLQLAPVSFDASTLEFWGSLLNGGELVLYPRGVLSLDELGELLASRGISVLWLTSALFQRMVDEELESLQGVRQVLAGGEALSLNHVRRYLDGLPAGHRLVNGYGPTENTTFTCCHVMAAGSDPGDSVPIGRPISNTRVYVLDAHRELVPVGVAGELYAGGDGLARGYLNQPDLTQEKFVSSPFAEGERLYRTGDRVRWRADGVLEYLGREDQQIKLRGYRIELGEVEHALTEHEGVREAVVMLREDEPGERRLVGYVVGEPGGESVSASVLRSYLQGRLPVYMVPSAIVQLASLPLTPVGKLDRDALPLPEGERQTEQAYVAPRSELEQRIASIWCEVLGVDQVGIDDNFFDLGGHSLLLIRLRARLESELGVEVPMVKLFQHPTVGEVARFLDGGQAAVSLHANARVRALALSNPGERSTAVAVIGMAGRFPRAGSISAYWEALRNGEELIRFFNDEELAAAGVPEALRSADNYVPARAVLDDVELFDAGFFGYTPREAELMDPQQRLFLESAYQALEDAGIDPSRYADLIGVYAGCSLDTYSSQVRSNQQLAAAAGALQLLISSAKDFLPTRVSYKLNLRGPSVNVQTACSTSLVAVHMACRSLLEHECDVALAGGVSVSVPRVSGYRYTEQGIMSPDGHCRAFDAESAGTVGGEGVGVVVLKRLDEALRDGDPIRAVIRGTAINNDGSAKVGYTAPSVERQAEAIALAQSVAGIEPSSIGYIEAHGTATSLGDPIEVEALNLVFAEGDYQQGRCALGSVKSNMGHLDAAAGVASLIKTVLMLEHGEIPPSLHYEAANPEIDFAAGPFYVNTALKPWERLEGQRRRAGVSSFGIGGTNAHAVLEEAPEIAASDPSRRWQVLPVSAKSEVALAAACENLAVHLEQCRDLALADVAYTLQVGRTGFERRVVMVCEDIPDAVRGLRAEAGAVRSSGEVRDGRVPEVVFLYPGQGTQYPNMGRELYEDEPVYRDTVDQCCAVLAEPLGLDLRTLLYPQAGDEDSAAESLKRTSLTQPALFVTEYALTQLLAEWGIRPVAMLGHSIGELVAACVSGVLDRDAALRLVAQRGRLMESAPAGVMISVLASAQQARGYEGDDVWLSVVNGPQASVLSCTPQAADALESRLQADDVAYQRLQTSHAFHCGLMDGVLEPLDAVSGDLKMSAPQLPYVSNVTGGWVDAELMADATYWSRQVREPVRFAEGVEALLTQYPDCVLLEVGPGEVLSQLVRGISKDRASAVVGTQSGAKDVGNAGARLAQALGELWCAGVEVDWQEAVCGERRLKVALPTYPFQRKRYWVEARAPGAQISLPVRRPDLSDWFYVPSWHRVGNLSEPGPLMQAVESRHWLIFADSTGVADRLCENLKQIGHRITVVSPGDRFMQHENESISIRAGDQTDYELLLKQLASSDDEIDDIVHLWGVTGETEIDEDELIEYCFYSPMFLAQALGRSPVGATGRLTLVTDEMQEVSGNEAVWPEKATVIGPCRVIPKDYPELLCRSIDLQKIRDADCAGGACQQLLNELFTAGIEPMVAYRNECRWLPSSSPMRIEQPVMETPARLRHQGVYLITGGLGGIGLALAKYLATTVSARLVLLGRQGLPQCEQWDTWLSGHEVDDKTCQGIRAVRELEAIGAEVLVLSADVTDTSQLHSVMQEVEQRFGRLHGAIHSAGVAGGGIIHLKTREVAAQVLSPKVTGTRVLAEVLRDKSLDFLVLCSSLASLTSLPGQIDYTAANAFQDAFAQSARRRWGTHTVSINWDAWSDAGMAVDTELPDSLAARRSEHLAIGLTSAEGQQAFERVLSSALWQVIVSPRNLVAQAEREVSRVGAMESERAELSSDTLHVSDTTYERPELDQEFVPPGDELEQRIADIWGKLLGIEQVGVHDDFFDLGGHSLLATQILGRIRGELSADLMLEHLFTHPTVAGLAQVVKERRLQPGQDDELSALTQQIDDLTQEEHQALLEQARRARGEV